MAENRAVVYGEIGIDNLISVPHPLDCERDAFVSRDEYLIGGYACNVSVLLALWGIPVRIAGYGIGDDENGRRILGLLGQYPLIDTSQIEVRKDKDTAFCRIIVPPNGDRYIMVYNLPERSSDPTPLTETMIGSAAHIVFDSLAQREAFLPAVKTAREAGLFAISSDINRLDCPIIPYIDAVCNSSAMLRSRDGVASPRAYACALHEKNGAIVVTTNGPNAIHVIDRDGGAFWVTPPRIAPEKIIDTTGAGDSLKAGLAYGLISGWPLERSVAFGAAAGALIIQAVGAVTREPSVQEITALMKQTRVSREPIE